MFHTMISKYIYQCALMCAYVHIYTHKKSSIFFTCTHRQRNSESHNKDYGRILIPFLCYHYTIIFGNIIFDLLH